MFQFYTMCIIYNTLLMQRLPYRLEVAGVAYIYKESLVHITHNIFSTLSKKVLLITFTLHHQVPPNLVYSKNPCCMLLTFYFYIFHKHYFTTTLLLLKVL